MVQRCLVTALASTGPACTHRSPAGLRGHERWTSRAREHTGTLSHGDTAIQPHNHSDSNNNYDYYYSKHNCNCNYNINNSADVPGVEPTVTRRREQHRRQQPPQTSRKAAVVVVVDLAPQTTHHRVPLSATATAEEPHPRPLGLHHSHRRR